MKSSSWREYYSTKFEYPSFLSDILLHYPYLCSILRARPRVLLEAGCGPGYHSLFLGLLLRGTRFVLVDRDWSVLQLARRVVKPLGHRVHFCQADILKLPFKKTYFDVVISQGTLEHFDDADSRKAVSEQLRVASQVIFSLPSDQYWQRDFGDEILRNPEQIKLLLKNRNVNLNYKVGYYKVDLGIRTKVAFYRHLRSKGWIWSKAIWCSFNASFHILGCLRNL